MYICKAGGTEHRHELASEGRYCWANGGPRRAVAPPAQRAEPLQPRVTERQIDYIERLGGDAKYAYKLTRKEASDYIERLKREGGKKKVTDSRLDMIKGMLDMIPDGYYATRKDDDSPVHFLRLSRPTKGKYAGTIKIQSQHSERWEVRAVLWPSGQWTTFSATIAEDLMLIIADYRTCTKRYAIELQACGRCNTQLTDGRSRHYLIGPECEKHWPWVIEEVNDRNDGLSYEALVARGLPTRIWQDTALPRPA